jgi:hypothetical protein
VKPSLILTVALLGIGFAAPVATASLVRSLDLSALVAEADQIVVADVLSIHAAWDPQHRTIHTTVDLGVRESWKGSVPADGRIAIRQLGGVVGDIEMTVHGMPAFTMGERALLFLRRAQVVGMSQGKRHLRWEQAKKRWLVEHASDESVVVLDGRGRLSPAPRQPTQALDELRARVRTLVSR